MAATASRRRLEISGTVQGVGMRPFVFRLATRLGLSGWVANHSGGVVIELQGDAARIAKFIEYLQASGPPLARIEQLNSAELTLQPGHEFTIQPSSSSGRAQLSIPTDRAPCPACLEEIRDPTARRYQYPFTSCTECGPRWSILARLPFDRANTSLQAFPTCPQCQREFSDPGDRRYHAQTIACPQCGPSLELLCNDGQPVAAGRQALTETVAALRTGRIVALKAVGGYQLLAAATNTDAIQRLRQGKQRPAKPLAVMCATLAQAATYCCLTPVEEQALTAPTRPIVLLHSRQLLPANIAPGNASLGVMLPASALQQLLLDEFKLPVVATSGNLSGEPLCFDNQDAFQRLGSCADVFLLHNLAICQPLDDSVVRVINGQAVTLRAGRGQAPYLLKVPLKASLKKVTGQQDDRTLLAVGGQLKNSVALAMPGGLLASQHIGDLDSLASQQRFVCISNNLQQYFGQFACRLVTDLHPEYASSHWAASTTLPSLPVQHHVAHFFSCLAEHGHRGPALGVCWDGSGLGTDGSLWGGEFFYWDGDTSVERVAHLRPFPLPGSEQAIREPRRLALALLYLSRGAMASPPRCLRPAFDDNEWCNLQTMIKRGVNSPQCSSIGRLIDAVAALLQVCSSNRYEAEAAMTLEAHAATVAVTDYLPWSVQLDGNTRIIDWQPLIEALLEQANAGRPVAELAAAFHNSLIEIIVNIAQTFAEVPIFLSGGVFQNRILTEGVISRLQSVKRTVFSHRQVPPNDGGLAVGQLYYALLMNRTRTGKHQSGRGKNEPE